MSTETSTGMAMRAAYIDADGAVLIRHGVPLPEVEPGHVLVRTMVSALCGSDLHRFRGATSYGFDTDVFGHETVGVITDQAGSGPRRVLALPFPAAGKVFADYQSVPTTSLIDLPDSLASETAVFGQQLGTVVFGLRRFLRAAGLGPDDMVDRAAVVGCGPAGLLFVKLLRLLGCREVAVVERVDYRRDLALRNGAVPPGGASYPLVVDTTGDVGGRAICLELVGDGGVVGLFGLPDEEPGELGLDVLTLLGRNLAIAGAMGAQGEPGLPSFCEAVALLAEGRLDVSDLVSHIGDIDDLPTLCSIAAHQSDDVSKVLIRFPTEEIPR